MAAVYLEIVEVSLRSHSTGRADSLPFVVLCSSQLLWIRAAPVNPGINLLMTLNITTSPERDVEVRQSPIHGVGVFARGAFEPGAIVLRWDVSRLITKEECALLSERERRYTHPFDEERMIVIQPPERFVNHSCNNNTVVRNFCDVAIRSIAPGEEITSDYASDGSGSQFACACGFENCRGQVN